MAAHDTSHLSVTNVVKTKLLSIIQDIGNQRAGNVHHEMYIKAPDTIMTSCNMTRSSPIRNLLGGFIRCASHTNAFALQNIQNSLTPPGVKKKSSLHQFGTIMTDEWALCIAKQSRYNNAEFWMNCNQNITASTLHVQPKTAPTIETKNINLEVFFQNILFTA